MTPLVSIVTMVHNSAEYLRECCLSVQQQTFRNFEHIIVDAESTDNPYEEVKGLPVTFVRLPEDRGMSTSRNVGFALARGRFGVNLDGDDRIATTFLERLLDRAGEQKLVCPWLQTFGAYGQIAKPGQWTNPLFCCTLFPMNAFLAVGGYDPALDRLEWEDWELWQSLMEHGCKPEIVPEVLFYWRQHQGSRTARTVGAGNSDSPCYKASREYMQRKHPAWHV